MNYWLLPPDPALRPFVQCYYVAEPRPGGAHHPDFRELELILPDGYAEIVFCGRGCYERWPLHKPGTVERVGASHVIAGRTQSAVTRDVEPVWLAGAKIDPWVLAALLRTPLNPIAGALVPVADIGNARLSALEDAILSCASPGRIGALLDGFFRRELADIGHCDPMVSHLRQAVDATHGSLAIMNWARMHAVDARTMERRFAAAMGMTPKRFARIVRFRRAYRGVLARSSASATDIDGFYDQSHFLKEFRAFTGSAPSLRRDGAQPQGFSISDHLIDAECPEHGTPLDRAGRASICGSLPHTLLPFCPMPR